MALNRQLFHEEYSPIILHYYSGFGSLQVFGHVGLQIGNTYYSFGIGDDEVARVTGKDMAAQIQREIDTYGGRSEHVMFELSTPTIDPREVQKKWLASDWKQALYNLANKNCGHAVFYLAEALGILPQQALKIDPLMLKPLTVVTVFQAQQQERIAVNRKNILAEQKINPILKIQRLLDNDIERFQYEILEQRANRISIDIATKQRKALQLIALREKLNEMKPADLLKEITLLKDIVKDRTGERLKECALCLAGLDTAPKQIAVYEEWQAHQAKELKAKEARLPWVTLHMKIKERLAEIPEVQDEKNNFYRHLLKALNKVEANEANYSNILAVIEMVKNLIKIDDDVGIGPAGRRIPELLSEKKITPEENQVLLKIKSIIRESLDQFDQGGITLPKLVENMLNTSKEVNRLHDKVTALIADKKQEVVEKKFDVDAKKQITDWLDPEVGAMQVKPLHVNWLHFKIKQICVAHRESKESDVANDLLIYIARSPLANGHLPASQHFANDLEVLMDRVWHDKMFNAKELNAMSPNSLVREVGFLLSEAYTLIGKPEHLPSNRVVLALNTLKESVTNPHVQDIEMPHLNKQRFDACRVNLAKQAHALKNIFPQLLSVLQELTQLYTRGAISNEDYLKEFMLCVRRIASTEKKPIRQMMLNALVDDIHELRRQVLPPVANPEARAEEVVNFVLKSIRDPQNKDRWRKQSTFGNDVKVNDQVTVNLPNSIYEMYKILMNPKEKSAEKLKKTTKVFDVSLAKHHEKVSSQLFQPSGDDKWLRLFYMGVKKLNEDPNIPLPTNPITNPLDFIVSLGFRANQLVDEKLVLTVAAPAAHPVVPKY